MRLPFFWQHEAGCSFTCTDHIHINIAAGINKLVDYGTLPQFLPTRLERFSYDHLCDVVLFGIIQHSFLNGSASDHNPLAAKFLRQLQDAPNAFAVDGVDLGAGSDLYIHGKPFRLEFACQPARGANQFLCQRAGTNANQQSFARRPRTRDGTRLHV